MNNICDATCDWLSNEELLDHARWDAREHGEGHYAVQQGDEPEIEFDIKENESRP